MLHYIHVILLLCFHLRMKYLFKLEIKTDKAASFKHSMTSYQTLNVDCFLKNALEKLISPFDFDLLNNFFCNFPNR